MKRIAYKNATLLSEAGRINDPIIGITDNKISQLISMEAAGDLQGVNVREYSEPVLIVPGFIDIHIHGVANVDVMDGTVHALEKMRSVLLQEGTTAFLATTITQSTERIRQALQTVNSVMQESNEKGAIILGVHLEGPFISNKRAGAQPIDYIYPPNIALFKDLQQASNYSIKLVTSAPEEPGGLALVEELKQTGVIPSIGHSDATYSQVKTAIEAGVCHGTHLFNGMRGIHHRDIGVAGAVFLHEEIIAELIVDGIHVSPEMVKLAYNTKGADGIILITDSMRAKGLKEGVSELGGQKVYVKNGQAILEDGTLAGSILKMNEAVKNMIKFSGCAIEEAIKMATVNPAKQLGIFDQKGSIQVGKDCDFVVLNEAFEVEETFVLGEKVFGKADIDGG